MTTTETNFKTVKTPNIVNNHNWIEKKNKSSDAVILLICVYIKSDSVSQVIIIGETNNEKRKREGIQYTL